MSDDDNKSSGLSDLKPMAIFIVGWILLGYIDKNNPGSGVEILKILLSIGGLYVGFKILSYFLSQSADENIGTFKAIAILMFWFVLAVIVAGLFKCGSGELNLNGVRSL